MFPNGRLCFCVSGRLLIDIDFNFNLIYVCLQEYSCGATLLSTPQSHHHYELLNHSWIKFLCISCGLSSMLIKIFRRRITHGKWLLLWKCDLLLYLFLSFFFGFFFFSFFSFFSETEITFSFVATFKRLMMRPRA